jgi:hypothetical protein
MAEEGVKGIIGKAVDKTVDTILTDPFQTLAMVDAATNVAMKLLPTLPGEFMIPIPRGIYDKLMESQGGQKK